MKALCCSSGQRGHDFDVRLWASMRGQTLARTVNGMMRYNKALRLLARLEADSSAALEMVDSRLLESLRANEKNRTWTARRNSKFEGATLGATTFMPYFSYTGDLMVSGSLGPLTTSGMSS